MKKERLLKVWQSISKDLKQAVKDGIYTKEEIKKFFKINVR